MDLKKIGIKVRNYKSFGSNAQGAARVMPVNLIVGRNNSGKSALIESIESAVYGRQLRHSYGNRDVTPQIVLTTQLTESALRRGFDQNQSGAIIPGNHWEFGSKFIGKSISWEYKKDSGNSYVSMDEPFGEGVRWGNIIKKVTSGLDMPFSGYLFYRLTAERDIVPEAELDHVETFSSNGFGFTAMVTTYLLRATLPSELVEVDMLRDLNQIFLHEGISFDKLSVRKLPDNRYEIFLHETNKGRVSLSNSGSGIKTVLLVLGALHLLPAPQPNPTNKWIYAFEELENSLHPSLQRRLVMFIREKAVSLGVSFFITTHSSAIIDAFSNDPEAQILHIEHDGTSATVSEISTYHGHGKVLDTLGVRASDLLQSNCIVWVEGPTDREYFNRWVELFSNGVLREGAHYQCVFYGGKLLSHLSSLNPTSDDINAVKILSVNRNAIVLMDSDKRDGAASVNSTKQRVSREVVEMGGVAWITAGREVENYIPQAAFASLYEKEAIGVFGQFQQVQEFLDIIAPVDASHIRSGRKGVFSSKILSHIELPALEKVLDIKERMAAVISYIKSCNSIV